VYIVYISGPVEKVVILDEDERERITFVGPYLEHQPLQLLCRATGGIICHEESRRVGEQMETSSLNI
jgi:hypothetical protein